MDTSTAAYRILEITAISGELPCDTLSRIHIGESYGEKLITRLKEDRLIKTHYKDKLRGYRLTSRGKKLLLAQNPERFSFYLTGSSDTTQPRSDYPRRLRLHQTLALECVRQGIDKIRINPGNIGSQEKVRAVADACRGEGIPIRIGVNGGSLERELLQKYGGVTPEALVESAMGHVRLLNDCNFDDTF